MGFLVKIEGSETINFDIKTVTGVKFTTDTPIDGDARAKDLGNTLTITGKILTAIDGTPFDDTKKAGAWSLISAENADCYRNVTVAVISAGQVVRQIVYPHAFVVDYIETYGDKDGVGTFKLVVKQKKDMIDEVEITGGFSA